VSASNTLIFKTRERNHQHSPPSSRKTKRGKKDGVLKTILDKSKQFVLFLFLAIGKEICLTPFSSSVFFLGGAHLLQHTQGHRNENCFPDPQVLLCYR
jgi:hypothetical protein